MKKRILCLIVGFIFIGFNVFAADGDLIVNGNATVNGKVGIGTTSPQGILHIYKSSGQDGILVDTGNVSTMVHSSEGGWSYIGTISNHKLGLVTGNNARMVIDSNGNVGIGTTNPGYKLEVNGQIRATSGTALYQMNSICSYGGLPTFSSTCSTAICGGSEYGNVYYNCSGICDSPSPQQCSNTLMGRLVAP